MKVAVISINMYSKGLNFACPIHTYAFQQLLLKYGIDNVIIDYKPVYYNNFDLKHPAEYYSRLYESVKVQNRNDKQEKMSLYARKRDAYRELYREREIRYDKFRSFIDTHYIKTELCYNSALLEITDPGFDCYICATDVIWKKEPGFGFDRGFFLGSRAMEGKSKIAYAASAGRWYPETEEDKKIFFHYVNDIDFLSVREPSLKSYIEENSDKKPVVVLDPVMMHDRGFYSKIAIKPRENKYVLLYHVVETADDIIEQAVRYAKEHNLSVVELTDKPLKTGLAQRFFSKAIYHYDIGVEEWVGYLLYADCVFTNSFHGCCFSILFEKELFVGKRMEDKVDYLLSMFEIDSRKLDLTQKSSWSEYPQIDYGKVKEILSRRRISSLEFLLSALQTCQSDKHRNHEYRSWKENQTYRLLYNSRAKKNLCTELYTQIVEGDLKELKSENLEFSPTKRTSNHGTDKFLDCFYARKGFAFQGWKVRVKIDREWFWYLEDGSLTLKDGYTGEKGVIKCFKPGEYIPYIDVNHIAALVAEAVWKKECRQVPVVYSTGDKKDAFFISCYSQKVGISKKLSKGKNELKMYQPIDNNGENIFLKNYFITFNRGKFLGWKIKVHVGEHWFWYMENGDLCLDKKVEMKKEEKVKVFSAGERIPYLPADYIECMVAEGVWGR